MKPRPERTKTETKAEKGQRNENENETERVGRPAVQSICVPGELFILWRQLSISASNAARSRPKSAGHPPLALSFHEVFPHRSGVGDRKRFDTVRKRL